MPILGIMASAISGNLFAPSGAYDSIATTTVGAGGASSITFSSIPSGYTHLQLRCYYLATNDVVVGVQLNGDTAANYSGHVLRGNGTTATAGAAANDSRMYFGYNYSVGGYSASVPMVAVVDLLDYADTNKYKTMRALSGVDYNGSGWVHFESGSWRNTNAVTSIVLSAFIGGTFNQYTSFALYGIK
jgi:hypothetical protein